MPTQRHTFLIRSSSADIDVNLNEVLRNVTRISIGFVQCPPVTANIDDFLYVTESGSSAILEGNGSSNLSGTPGNPSRCFITLPAPSATDTRTYTYGDYEIDKSYSTPFALTSIRLKVVNAAGELVTFDPTGPDFGILFICFTQV